MILHDFIVANRDEIISRTSNRGSTRVGSQVSPREHQNGVPLFLTQLCEALRREGTETAFPQETVGVSAAKHGMELSKSGCTLAQVVHEYGDICQAITGLAFEQHESIPVEQFKLMNLCLDTAIAEAVTEFARLTPR